MDFIYTVINRATDPTDEEIEEAVKGGKSFGSVIIIIISILVILMYCASCIICCCMMGKFKRFRETHLVEVDEQGNAIGPPISQYQNLNTNKIEGIGGPYAQTYPYPIINDQGQYSQNNGQYMQNYQRNPDYPPILNIPPPPSTTPPPQS